MITVDVAIIGGGLAGLLAAIRLQKSGQKVAVIDRSLTESHDLLGGFAAFSGAKFSFPPAGLGLVPLVRNAAGLNEKIGDVLLELGLNQHTLLPSEEHSADAEITAGNRTLLRRYHSLLLSPEEIEELVLRLSTKVEESCVVIRGIARAIEPCDSAWNVSIKPMRDSSDQTVHAKAIFFAGGRLSSDILLAAGATPSEGKGLDVGVRFEFFRREAIAGLRALGADAKIIDGRCRTFCLNSPGTIYRYPFGPVSIPGGVVAGQSELRANFGVLYRVDDKSKVLRDVIDAATTRWAQVLSSSDQIFRGAPFGDQVTLLSELWGVEITNKIQQFCIALSDLNLVDWSYPHKVHLPLIDWHWNTFARADSHLTNLPNVYALGDVSGHARGLLQASLSGWIAAEEYLNA